MTSSPHHDWPSVIDYQRAVADPKTSFTHPDLQQCTPELDSFGLPFSVSGAFAHTYKLRCGSGTFAVRFFQRFDVGRSIRLPLIQQKLSDIDHPSLLPFDYDPEGIVVNDAARPVMTMPWINGTDLRGFVDQQINNQIAILDVKNQFINLLRVLHEYGVAHGDLQHGNIIVTPSGRLHLIDYDGMYVPCLSGMSSPVLGQRHYQHPTRNGHDFGPHMDRFSARLICETLSILAADPSLWATAGSGNPSRGDDFLLWRANDLAKPNESKLFDQLKRHDDGRIRRAADRVLILLKMPLRSIPVLSTLRNGLHV